MARANWHVFVNCPFDGVYQPFFRAIVFTIVRSGFFARCALETDDAADNRFEKICGIIGECRYGIHDISRTELDQKSQLPRFNMPLELGLFLGARRYGSNTQRAKRCIVFDRDRFRFQAYISDIAGQDIHAHGGDVTLLIVELASWLRDQSRRANVPGGKVIAAEFLAFQRALADVCADRQLEVDELTFGDYADMVTEYLAEAVARQRLRRHGR
jgi:hypothetical protein